MISTESILEEVEAKKHECRLVILPIGLPGSGKSTFVKTLSNMIGYQTAIHSTDNFFIEDGEYKFNPTSLGRYHKQNLENFKKSLDGQVPVVIVDNTNLKARDRNKYVRLAESAGYNVQMVVIGEFSDEAVKLYAKRNKHKVPLEKIEQMAKGAAIPEGAL